MKIRITERVFKTVKINDENYNINFNHIEGIVITRKTKKYKLTIRWNWSDIEDHFKELIEKEEAKDE